MELIVLHQLWCHLFLIDGSRIQTKSVVIHWIYILIKLVFLLVKTWAESMAENFSWIFTYLVYISEKQLFLKFFFQWLLSYLLSQTLKTSELSMCMCSMVFRPCCTTHPHHRAKLTWKSCFRCEVTCHTQQSECLNLLLLPELLFYWRLDTKSASSLRNLFLETPTFSGSNVMLRWCKLHTHHGAELPVGWASHTQISFVIALKHVWCHIVNM